MLDIHANKIIANKFVGEFENNNDGFNVGDIKWSATDLTQVGFLVANGASIRKDTYADLFNAIGTTYGSIDEEHFNLPNLIGRFIEGSEIAGGYKEAGLPNIYGHTAIHNQMFVGEQTFGALEHKGYPYIWGNIKQIVPSTADTYYTYLYFNASKYDSIYGKSSTVQPPSVLLTPYIKAFKGTSATSTDIEITNLAQDIVDKANRDLSNLSEQGRKTFFPSDTFVDIPLALTQNLNQDLFADNCYTAPANGYFWINVDIGIGSQNGRIWVRSSSGIIYRVASGITSDGLDITIPLKKGDKVSIHYINVKNGIAKFIYAEGEI